MLSLITQGSQMLREIKAFHDELTRLVSESPFQPLFSDIKLQFNRRAVTYVTNGCEQMAAIWSEGKIYEAAVHLDEESMVVWWVGQPWNTGLEAARNVFDDLMKA